MARPAAARPVVNGSEPSVGDLVAQAVRDATQLVRFEINLAKLELRDDVQRVGLAAVLAAMVAFTGCLVLVLLCIALAFGLVALGIWPWAAFLIVAGLCVLLAGLAVLIVVIKVRGISGLRKTRATLQEDMAVLKRDENAPAPPAVEAG